MENKAKDKKLLLVGATNGSIHVKNYYLLIKDFFEEILVITGNPIDFCKFEIADFSIKYPLSVPKKIKKIKEIISDFQPDVIHIHQANSIAYLTTKANVFNIPTVLTCWGSDVLVLPQKGFFYKHIVRYSLKRADVITADANYMAQAVKRLGVNKDVVIANFGIDYINIEIPKKENIIYSNRLHKPLYRIDQIILAFSEFVKQYPDWKLVIGATGESTQELTELAQKVLSPNEYSFIGFVDSETNKEYYLKSKIWVSFPESDGTAISLLEAMGYGCIPVVSDLPANREWIDDGQNGIVVTSSVAKSLNDALNLSLEIVQKRNHDIIIQRGTKEVNRSIFYNLYDSVLTEKKSTLN